MPNRRKPVTKEITEYIINKDKALSNTNPDNIYSLTGDYFVLGEQASFKRKEWAQDRDYLQNIQIINIM